MLSPASTSTRHDVPSYETLTENCLFVDVGRASSAPEEDADFCDDEAAARKAKRSLALVDMVDFLAGNVLGGSLLFEVRPSTTTTLPSLNSHTQQTHARAAYKLDTKVDIMVPLF